MERPAPLDIFQTCQNISEISFIENAQEDFSRYELEEDAFKAFDFKNVHLRSEDVTLCQGWINASKLSSGHQMIFF